MDPQKHFSQQDHTSDGLLKCTTHPCVCARRALQYTLTGISNGREHFAVQWETRRWSEKKDVSKNKNHTMVDCKYSTVEIPEWAPRAWPSAASVPNMEAERDGK